MSVRVAPITLVLAIVLLTPLVVFAQAGFYLTPSLGLSLTYDDNIFGRSENREGDFITRLTPGVSFGYQSASFSALLDYATDAEYYLDHDDLSGFANRHSASLSVSYVPIQRLSLGFGATYTRTENPSELSARTREQQSGQRPITVTGTESGREETSVYSVSANAAYQITPLWSTSGGYVLTIDESGGIENTSHSIGLSLSRIITARDTVSLNYGLSLFSTEDDTVSRQEETEVSHVATVGWSRQFSPVMQGSLRAGIRFTEGEIDPEIQAAFSRTFQRFMVAAGYSYTRSTVVARAGSSEVQYLNATIGFRPLARLVVSAGPSIQYLVSDDRDRRRSGTSAGTTGDTWTYAVGANATYQILRWLSAYADYRFTFETGDRDDVYRNILTLGLRASYPFRIY